MKRLSLIASALAVLGLTACEKGLVEDIPNREVSGEMVNAVEETAWTVVARALQQSERLLTATLRGDAETVARLVEAAHDSEASIFKYYDADTKQHTCNIERWEKDQ